MIDRDSLLCEIAFEESRLKAAKAEAAESTSRLAELRRLLSEEGEPSGHCEVRESGAITPESNEEKVALFRSLFRGREDVFPRLWVNERSGRRGYSPVCANEWSAGLCSKRKEPGANRRAVCGECPNRAFVPLSDQEVIRHLRGEQVIGVYPLLPDETCRFIAADFDGDAWRDDVSAFAETCGAIGVPAAIERSRSGNGAHAWFFFSSPVSASAARKFACHLITETMARRHQISMQSYDRLFPNQDTLPKGGFGNLIALPLQGGPRKAGNTVFVDPTFTPWPDQWAFLVRATRMESDIIQTIADEAGRRGLVTGVRFAETETDVDSMPWERAPSGRMKECDSIEPLPARVNAVLCQRLFIEKAGLPSPMLNRLKRLAAFQNPEFYKKQSMRLSTALTPRIISCAEDLPEHIALPRGCLAEAAEFLGVHGAMLVTEDRREDGSILDVVFHGTLTPRQEEALEAMLAHEIGILVAPPGTGKTVVGIGLIAARKRSTLVLVHRKPLLDQWISQLSMFLGMAPGDIGRIGGGKSRPNGRLDVAMVQSLVRKGAVSDQISGYGQVILDEAHHCPAVSFERVLSEVKARYLVGLTATPQRRDGSDPILYMQLGPIRFAEASGCGAMKPPFSQRLVVRNTGFRAEQVTDATGIQELYSMLAADESRNDLIVDDLVRLLGEGRSPILLTERRDHLEYLAGRMRSITQNIVVLRGGMKAGQRREAAESLASIPDNEERLLIATGRYIGEGFDDSRLDTLLLALPIAWKGTLVQYTGRLHRLHPQKTSVRIYDYLDGSVPVLSRMFQKRLKGYRSIGYSIEE
jgi:superfamily II DNA or RNA helicase